MNRFFRTAYSTTLVYLCLTFFGVLITKETMPFPAFSCLYFGLLLFLLPDISQKLIGKELLFSVIGTVTAMLGFLPIALWHCPMLHWLIHLSGITAAVVFLLILQHRTTHRLFLEKFRSSVILLFLLIGLAFLVLRTDIMMGGEASLRYETVNLAMNSVVPYTIVLLASGVLLLRGLRAQPGRMVDEQAFNRLQLRDTLIFAVLVTLLFVVDPFPYLGKAVSFLLSDVLQPSFRFLARLLASLLPAMSFGKQPAKASLPAEEVADSEAGLTVELPELQMEQNYKNYIEKNSPAHTAADYVVLAAITLVVLFILAILIRILVRNAGKRSRDRWSGYPRETYEMLPKIEKNLKKKSKKRNTDPRERIRYLYGEFLHFLHKRQVPFDQTNTCGEIRQDAEKMSVASPSMLSDLTALYEETRYRMEKTPTETDANAMKDLLDRIKKKL